MKNIFAICFTLLVLSGCKKFLQEDPKGLLVGDLAISSVEGLNAQLAGAYATVIGDWGNGFASAGPIGMSMGGDDVTTHSGLNKQDFREYDQFAVSATNDRMLVIWNGLYKTIQSASNIITNYQKVAGDKATISQILGEAYFLRGFSYYYIVRWWGKVPLITTTFSQDLLTVTRSGTADVYKLIEADLQQAEGLVSNTKLAPGRINKGVVKAYLADVYLTESGWPLKDQTKIPLAAAKAKEVIDNKAAYGFDLYQGGFGNIFAGGTSEDVFTVFTDNNTTSNHFYGMSGLPGDEGGWDDYCSEINFFNNFPAGSRKDATFLTSVTVGGTTIPWQQFALKHPYYQKFKIQVKDKNPIDYSSASPILLMRYAEVLLTYAEAKARNGEPDADAYAAVNAVRERAGLADLPAGLSAADLTTAILNERSWEFACEWHRWFDLVRTETVGVANSNRAAGEIPLVGDPNNRSNWWLPVPYSDASINPNLNK